MDPTVDFQAIVWAMGDAVIGADRDGAIRLWNPAAERMFGFTADEALGRSLDLIIPERFRNRHWEEYRQVMRTGQTKYGACPCPSQGQTDAFDRFHGCIAMLPRQPDPDDRGDRSR